MKVLESLARFCAILAGLLLVFITVMTCVSIVGRDVFGKAINGDFELSGAAISSWTSSPAGLRNARRR